MHLGECPASPMEPGRGDQIKLINPSLGTEKLDVHLIRLVPGGPRGKLHHHTNADNVYIVKRGEGTLTVEGRTYLIRENDVVYIPAGLKHSLRIWMRPTFLTKNMSKYFRNIWERNMPASVWT